jgi:gluconolactonase
VVLVPNGIALSPDETVLYVSDSNSAWGRPLENHAASVRNVYFDVQGTMIGNPRVIYVSESGWPDGIRVTKEGLLIATVMGGADGESG